MNAIWDLWGKVLHKPVWQIVADMTPEEFVQCIDFRYITDVMNPEEAVKMLEKTQAGKEKRMEEAWNNTAVPVDIWNIARCEEQDMLMLVSGVYNLPGLAGI